MARRADNGPLRGVDERTAERDGEREGLGDGEESGYFFEAILLPTSRQFAAIYHHRMLYVRLGTGKREHTGVMVGSVHAGLLSNQKNRNTACNPTVCFSCSGGDQDQVTASQVHGVQSRKDTRLVAVVGGRRHARSM